MDNGLNRTVTIQVAYHKSSHYIAKRDSVELCFSMTFSYTPAMPIHNYKHVRETFRFPVFSGGLKTAPTKLHVQILSVDSNFYFLTSSLRLLR